MLWRTFLVEFDKTFFGTSVLFANTKKNTILTFKILIGLAALFGFFRLFRMTDTFAKTILILQISAIGLTLLSDKTTAIGLILFTFTLAMAIFYGLSKKEFQSFKRLQIIFPAALLFVTHVFQLLHYSGAGLLGLTLVLPFIAYVILITTDLNNYKNELGFITIIVVASTIEFLKRLEWLMN